MHRRSPVLVLACALWIAAAACGPQPDLRTLKLLPTMSGYYDDGVQPDGQNRLLPSLTFQVKNEGNLPVANVDLVLAFWEVGADGENDSKQIRGIGNTALEPGQTSEALTVRASIGYRSPAPRAEFFSNSFFKGFTVKVFAKLRGRTTPIGEFPVEPRLLPAAGKDGSRP
jgi:hypothetical protein